MAKQQYAGPITEMPNALSENIDVASVKGIIKMIHKCEKEIFKGWHGSKGVYDDTVLEVMNLVMEKACSIIQQDGESGIVLSGCGTSGRLAFMITRSFNLCLRQLGLPPCLHYLIAGGDEAVFASREAPEDKPLVGQADLQKLCESMDTVLYVGISCGLSAPYVAGQLDYCMQHIEKFTPVLLGFNPPYLARNVPIEGWDKTFYEVVMELEKLTGERKACLITPIIGPEPVTGSSRMKGGSATKIIVESILTAATLKASSQGEISMQNIISAYELVQKATYKDEESLCQMVDIAAASLAEGGHLHYVGYDSLGLVGIIDASECPPTFGAGFEDVQGFVQGGYQMLRNREGALKEFDLSLEHFEEAILPNFRDEDVTIVLCKDDEMTRGTHIADSSSLTAQTMAINFIVTGNMLSMAAGERCKVHTDVAIPWQEVEEVLPSSCLSICQSHLVEISCKWLCNVLTTASYVRTGNVFRNYMVAVTVSNSKLYHRAIGIVEKLGNCKKETAMECVLRAIYNTDQLDNSVLNASIDHHIQHVSRELKVVPTALIMAITGCSVSEARVQLAENPVIRTAIANSMR